MDYVDHASVLNRKGTTNTLKTWILKFIVMKVG